VSSAPGSGSTFSVYLPVLLDAGAELPLAGTIMTATAPLPGTGRIMLIDDEENILNLSRKILQRSMYTVSAFTSSREALAAFYQNPSEVDIVLTDLSMPEFDGIELTKRMLAIRPNLPVILCTGYGDAFNLERSKEAGAAGFIQKPFTSQSLLQTIRGIFDERTH
jgi:DNA-binding NtrC family response regulator